MILAFIQGNLRWIMVRFKGGCAKAVGECSFSTSYIEALLYYHVILMGVSSKLQVSLLT